MNQTGGNNAEPCLGQHQPNPLGISSEIGFQIGARIGSKPVSPCIPARMESVSVDPLTPRPWKHQSSHPLDQILYDINTGGQTRSKLKNFCAFYAFLSNIEPKNVNEALADSDWVTAM